MDTSDNTIAAMPPESFAIIGYCPCCSHYQRIDLQTFSSYTLEELHYKIHCVNCGHQGLDCGVIK